MKRKLTALFLALVMALPLAACGKDSGSQSTSATQKETAAETSGSQTEAPTEKQTEEKPAEAGAVALPFRVLTGEELTLEMGMGWNLGNTMDGHTGFTPNEIQWQDIRTTRELIKAVHDAGFNTVRVPVTWGTMIDDNNNYSIDEKWISRVQDIVDYAIEQDMYVIVNIHHDGAEQSGWLRIATDDKESLRKKFGGVWKNIAERFKDYDEHLIFEAMNEVRGVNMNLAEQNGVIMELNQIFVDTVRATGSNNAQRWLCVCGTYNYIDSLVNPSGKFELPNDEKDKIMLSVHCYTPWGFCGTESTADKDYTLDELKNTNEKELQKLEQFTSKGIPVIVGEYGCINKDNPEERAFYLEGMNRIYSKYNLIGIFWDQGWYDRSEKPDYSFTIFDRVTGEPVEKIVTDAMVRGFFKSNGGKLDGLEKNTEVTPIESIEVDVSDLKLKVGGEITLKVTETPTENNDVVLYKTDDPYVASVYNGKIRAKGIGETKITVFSQGGAVEKTVNVKVEAADASTSCESIEVKDSYEFTVGEYAYLEAKVNAGCDAVLTYKSSDNKVATVSTVGKILAVGEGSAVITVCSADGHSTDVNVEVKAAGKTSEITLALNVYFNDSKHNYFNNEVSSQTITVDKEGQYTLKFDCAADLSAAAADAGVKYLENLTAIYIKDYDVTKGNASVSPLKSCDIMYDKVVVNGQELTVTQKEPKSALKDSGIFDTNDPVNSWDGSAVEEVKCSGNVANFSTIDEPATVEITFTLSNMEFN